MATRPSGRTDVSRSAVLAQLGARPASRAELARVLSVSPALITQVVRDLLADGLIKELEQSPSQGGRPARLLGLVTSAGRAVGLKIAPDHLVFVDVALDGTVIRSAQEPFDASAPTLLDDLSRSVRAYLATDDDLPVLGIGVAVPGTVDSQASGVVDSVQLGWAQTPLGAHLRRSLGLPVLVENNVNALAIAERLFGIGRSYDTFATLTIGTGVGLAIVMDGGVMRGGAGGAGEIGHLPVVANGSPCTCGNRGCLETVVGQQALEQTGRDLGVIKPAEGIDELVAAADAGDVRAQTIFENAGHTLARAVAGLVQILDPEVIVLLGEGTAAWAHWSVGFEPEFRACLLPSRRGVPLMLETWNDESWAQGAACLVLSTPFDIDLAGEQGRLVRSRLADRPTLEGASRGR